MESDPLYIHMVWDKDVSHEPDWLDIESLKTFLLKGLEETPHINRCPIECSLRITRDPVSQSYNALYRHCHKPTNILAFPSVADSSQWFYHPCSEGRLMIGDLLLNQEAMIREADEQRKLIKAHGYHLVLHGFLHLLHYDHQTLEEAEVMENIEKKIMHLWGWPDPYMDYAISSIDGSR